MNRLTDDFAAADELYAEVTTSLTKATMELRDKLAAKHRIDVSLVDAVMAKAMLMNGTALMLQSAGLDRDEAFAVFDEVMQLVADRGGLARD